MAIIVEERRNTGNIINFLIWAVILIVVIVSIYYIFFKNPELVEFTGSSSFKNVQELSKITSKITINPEGLVNTISLKLKRYVTVTPPQNVGRSNPFLSF